MSRLQPYVPPGAAAVLALEGALCRWPLGEVASPEFRFCLASAIHGSYCAGHARLARRSR